MLYIFLLVCWTILWIIVATRRVFRNGRYTYERAIYFVGLMWAIGVIALIGSSVAIAYAVSWHYVLLSDTKLLATGEDGETVKRIYVHYTKTWNDAYYVYYTQQPAGEPVQHRLTTTHRVLISQQYRSDGRLLVYQNHPVASWVEQFVVPISEDKKYVFLLPENGYRQ